MTKLFTTFLCNLEYGYDSVKHNYFVIIDQLKKAYLIMIKDNMELRLDSR